MVSVEEELQRILKASGIESSPVDPSSMNFLRQLVQDNKQNKKKAKTYANRSALEPQEAVERNSTAAASLPGSVVAGTPGQTSLSNSDAAMILEQLKMQTNLILSLQDKIQVLSDKVNQLDGTGVATRTSNMEEEQQQQRGDEEDASAPRLRIFRREVRVVPPPEENAPRRRRRQDDRAPAAEPEMAGPQELQPNVITWFFRTTRLFWVLSRDYVRPIDGALLFKLVFMTMVVMARLSKKSTSKNKSKDPKIVMVSCVLCLGFLFHTRYIQYVYQFLWKQNVPGRVWKGEQNITIPPPEQENNRRDNWNNNNNNNDQQPPRQRNPVPPGLRRNNDNNNDGEERPAPWWQRNDFLVGGVAPIDDHDHEEGNPPPPVNPIAAVVQGIYYLVGSFVFSIFPMWNPQGHQQRRPLRRERLDGAAAAEANNNNDNGGMIPQVRAPRDAMEAAEDDSDDE